MSDTTAPNGATSIPETAWDIASAIREERVSPLDVVERAFRRIRDRDPEIRAFLAFREEEACAEAEALAHRDDLGTLALAGVPIGVKDNLDVEGLPVTLGSSALQGEPAGADHPVVARLRAAGAIVVGKTTLPELGVWATTDGFWGATRNPCRPDRRLVRRERCRGGRRHDPAGCRKRRLRFDPDPRRVLRHRRAQAQWRHGSGRARGR